MFDILFMGSRRGWGGSSAENAHVSYGQRAERAESLPEPGADLMSMDPVSRLDEGKKLGRVEAGRVSALPRDELTRVRLDRLEFRLTRFADIDDEVRPQRVAALVDEGGADAPRIPPRLVSLDELMDGNASHIVYSSEK